MTSLPEEAVGAQPGPDDDLVSCLVQEIGRGTKVFDAAAVQGRFMAIESPDDVLTLMDDGRRRSGGSGA
jgi:hypothetical protein